jgi:hypothetical protein
MKFFRNSILLPLLGLIVGIGIGLLYTWQISPVTYVDADPSILRADFKDQYRIVIAAAYASTHDLPRARARLELLKDPDLIGELSAQAQRMMADGESNQSVQPLAQLAADLEKGYASLALPTATATKLSFAGTPFTPFVETPGAETPTAEEILESETPDPLVVSTLPFEQTPLAPQELELVTATPRPTSTPTKGVERPFALADQETVCDPNLTPGLLQFVLTDSRRDPVASKSSSHGTRVKTTCTPGSNPRLGTATLISSCRRIPFTASAWWKAAPLSPIFLRRPARAITVKVTSAGCCSPFNSHETDRFSLKPD